MDFPELQALKQDVLHNADAGDCFVLTLADEQEGQEAEEHILQWLADRGLTHSVRRHRDTVYVSPLPLTDDDWQEIIASDDAGGDGTGIQPE